MEHNEYNTWVRILKKPIGNSRVLRLAMLSDFATQHLAKAIKAAGAYANFDFDIWEADYDSIEQTIINETSPLYTKQFDYILIFPSVFKLYKLFSNSDKQSFALEQKQKINNFINTINSRCSSKIILSNFPETDDRVFGNYSNKTPSSFLFQLRKLNFGIMDVAMLHKNLFILDVQYLQTLYGKELTLDDKLHIHADIIYQLDFCVSMAKEITSIVNASEGAFKKCVILDLDNTLWGGVIGDDGIENIEIGDDIGIGKAYYLFQTWLKNLKDRGIILAVCSKNSEEIAKEPFLKHPGMVLKLEDISVFVANWETKVDNIVFIQSVLNIGFDSMVFLDDNPFERNIIKQYIPEISVPDLPEDPAEFLSFLQNINLFETASFTDSDLERTRQYRDEAKRTQLRKVFNSENEYLEGLNMQADVKPIDSFTLPRVTQLIQRSNQFNLRTIRYSESDIERIMNDRNFETITVSLSDTYGNYGLISVVILERKLDHFFIDTWIMSCRVLKRGVENLVLNEIVNLARSHGLKGIIGEYLLTRKNQIVKDHYKELGFAPEGSTYFLPVTGYSEKTNFIQAKKFAIS